MFSFFEPNHSKVGRYRKYYPHNQEPVINGTIQIKFQISTTMTCCSPHCAAIYLLTGTLFLTFVYTLLSTQPFFLSGVNVDNIDHIKASALGALLLFVVLFVISIVGIQVHAVRRNNGRNNDDDDDDDGRGSYRNLINANLDYQLSNSNNNDGSSFTWELGIVFGTYRRSRSRSFFFCLSEMRWE